MNPHDGTFFSAILFDMDGTLVDTEPLWLVSETELMDEYDYAWTSQDQANCLGGPLDRVGEYMHDLAGKVESPEFFRDSLIARMAEKLHRGAVLMDGAAELLQVCAEFEIPVALVSASPRILVDAVLENLPSHRFQVSVSSDDVVNTKPDPEGYLKSVDMLGVDIATCLILEDSLTGVEAARASGGFVVAIPHLVPIDESARVRVVSTVRELDRERLISLFKELNGHQ
ncbi:MAG TPA: HAD family phosphatase [Candidatus Paceibacterota bacterium]|nr:HAD family phosphatase [Candidatus Paceibacterota bacterium]